MVIYKITNKINNKCYIGQTIQKSVNNRWSRHKSDYRKKVNHPLYDSMNKYGIENFSFEIIYTANSIEELNKLEEQYIKDFNSLVPNGYNLKMGGNNSKVPNRKSGGPRPDVSKRMKGIPKSEESKQKMRQSLRNHWKNNPHPNAKLVLWINMNIIFNSGAEAARYLNCSSSSITDCCNGKIKSFKHHTFEYLNLESEN